MSLRGEHVTFDSLDMLLPAGVRRVQQALVDLVCAAMLLFLAWLMWDHAGKMAEYGDVTNRLRIALYPFVYAMSVMCALSALVHLMLTAAAGGAPPRRRRGRLLMSRPAGAVA